MHHKILCAGNKCRSMQKPAVSIVKKKLAVLLLYTLPRNVYNNSLIVYYITGQSYPVVCY